MTFPPVDCDGKPLECGDKIHYVTQDRKLQLVEIVGVFPSNGKWALDCLTPAGLQCRLEGTEHCKKAEFGYPLQFDVGIPAPGVKVDGPRK